MTPPLAHDEPDSLLPEALDTAELGGARNTRRTSAEIFALTWPVILGQLMAQAVPLIDVLMLGRLGTPTLAAVGYAAQFLMLVQASLLAVGAACVALMARALGARDVARARRGFAACLRIALWLTAVLAAITLLFPRELLHLLAVKESVVHLAVPYFRLTLSSVPLMALSLGYEHAFRAAKDTLVPMAIAGVVSLLKIGLNALFIFGHAGFPELGLPGAGVATILSQAVAVTLFLTAARRHKNPALHLRLADLRVPAATMREAVALAMPAVGERFVMTAAMLFYFRFLGGYGLEAVAAYNVGVRILAFTWIPGLGLSVAAATLVGHALGAGDGQLARRSGWLAARIGFLISLALGTLFIALRIPMARLFTDDVHVIDALDPFILLLGLGLPFLVVHFTLAGALRGAGDTLTPLKAAILGNWVFRVPLGYLFAQVLQLPLFWVWSIMMIDHLSRALWLGWSFHTSDWQARVGAGVDDTTADVSPARAN
ncbi:MAG TPA: MATE family efflux transporter [Polyangiales bacterium]|nr:MATE family efflux transporter [Polyangiales bacterium]